MKENINTKEAIKARMLDNAVKIWGLKSISSLDPFVKLLIEAFSNEIFNVNGEIELVNTRILEKLARLLTPSIYIYPQPAHTIGVLSPNESNVKLSKEIEFSIQRSFSTNIKSTADKQVNISFTSVDNIEIVNMKVCLQFVNNTCYSYDDSFNKLSISKLIKPITNNKIFLAIDCTDYNDEILPNNLPLFCSNPTYENIDILYKLLPFVEIKNNNSILNIKNGITYHSNYNSKTGFEELLEQYSIENRIVENIKNIYNDKFIEITNFKEATIEEGIPEYLKDYLNIKDLLKHIENKKFIWLELNFSPQYELEVLENFSFYLNAVPLYNRSWKSNESKVDVTGNIVPLATELFENYLFVDKVSDNSGNLYDEIPFSQTIDNNRRLYTVRSTGMERFNERSAINKIAEVIELIRDEVSSFSIIGRDGVSNSLSNIYKQLRLLEKNNENADNNSIKETSYVIVDSISKVKNIKVDYWISNAEMANNIRASSILKSQHRSQVNFVEKAILLFDTNSGYTQQKGTDALQAYKYALTTRDKIITIEDVKSFCNYSIKEELQNLEVKRGIDISDNPKEGFVRTIEINITPQNFDRYGEKYWNNYANSIKKQIQMRAIDGVEYRIKILEPKI
jgi:hypothetical protein